MGWKRISRRRAFQKGVSLLRTKSRDNVGTAITAGQPPDRSGKVDAVHGLVGSFCSEWAFLPNLGSGSLLIIGVSGNSYKGLSQFRR